MMNNDPITHKNCPDNITPLLYALYIENIALADSILRCSSRFTPTSHADGSSSTSQVSPLGTASRLNQEDFVELSLSRNHGGQDSEGEAFVSAARHGHCGPLRVLFRHNVNVAKSHGTQALAAAVLKKKAEAVAFLLEDPVSLPVPARDGDRVLCSAALTAAVMSILLRSSIGSSALSATLTISMSDDNEETSVLLLAHGAQKEDLAIINAIRAHTLAAAIRLVMVGFDVRGRYFRHLCTALHYAIEKGFADVASRLLDAGAAGDTRDRGLRTPLQIGAREGRKECVGFCSQPGQMSPRRIGREISRWIMQEIWKRRDGVVNQKSHGTPPRGIASKEGAD